jgi:hypothetical protein
MILIWKYLCFAKAYLIENRANLAYNHFIDTFIFYQGLFNNSGSLGDILNMPYPFFTDIILAQVKEKKNQQKQYESLQR